MRMHLELNCENEAFSEDAGAEIARILRTLAERVEGMIRYDAQGCYSGNLRDINGNTVGAWKCRNEDAPDVELPSERRRVS